MLLKWNILKAKTLIERNNHEANSTCYRDTVIDELTNVYRNKCSACERDRGTELQVDHYRPRKQRNNQNTRYNQPGYYWLTYEWSNLIPLCSKCNSNKSNKFPLKGWGNKNRISSHENTYGVEEYNPFNIEWLQQKEKPLIINPELEVEPATHFYFKKNGEINGRTIYGKETILIYKLNRKDLKRERIKIRGDYVNKINESLDDYVRNKNENELYGALKAIFKDIMRNTSIDRPHSLFHKYIYLYFEYFIGSFLQIDISDKVNNYFNSFKEN